MTNMTNSDTREPTSALGLKFNQDPKFKNRRRGAAVVLAAGVVATFVGGNMLAARVQGTGPTVENPAQLHPDQHFNTYVVQPGDTLTDIVNRAYPGLAPYSAEFRARVAALNRQLPEDDQFMGTIRPGSTELELDASANLKNVEADTSKP